MVTKITTLVAASYVSLSCCHHTLYYVNNNNNKLNVKIIPTSFLQCVRVATLGDKLMLEVPAHLFDSYDVSNKDVFYLALNFASQSGSSLQVLSFLLEWDLSQTMTDIALLFDGFLLSYFLELSSKKLIRMPEKLLSCV